MRHTQQTVGPVREALTQRNWTIARGAAELGYSYGYFAMMIREPRLISAPMAQRLAEVLGVQVADAPAPTVANQPFASPGGRKRP